MNAQHQILYLMINSLIIMAGCAKRIPISYDEVKPNAVVQIEAFSGKTWRGEIQEKESNYILLKQNRFENDLTRIDRNEIAAITGSHFVEDGNGGFISEWEIQKKQGINNFILHTIGGAGLSFGASFFMGSLLHRGIDNSDQGKKILWSVTGLGTTLGTYVFAKSGRKKDRMLAIEDIRDQKYNLSKQRFQNQKTKRQIVEQELEKEKMERAKQEAELKRLQEELEKKKQP